MYIDTAIFVWVRTKPLMPFLLTTLCSCQSWRVNEPINTSHWGSTSKVYLYIKGTGTKTGKKQYLSLENTPSQFSHFYKRWCSFYKEKKLNCSYPNEKSYSLSDISQPYGLLFYVMVCLKVNRTDISQSSDFALYMVSWSLLDGWTSNFWIRSQCDPTFDLRIDIGQSDLYFMAQWFCFIAWRLFG